MGDTDSRLTWRDNALDTLVSVLARDKSTQPLGRRLAHYLRHSRAIETDDGAGGIDRLAEWTAERLPELERPRQESILLPPRASMISALTGRPSPARRIT